MSDFYIPKEDRCFHEYKFYTHMDCHIGLCYHTGDEQPKI